MEHQIKCMRELLQDTFSIASTDLDRILKAVDQKKKKQGRGRKKGKGKGKKVEDRDDVVKGKHIAYETHELNQILQHWAQTICGRIMHVRPMSPGKRIAKGEVAPFKTSILGRLINGLVVLNNPNGVEASSVEDDSIQRRRSISFVDLQAQALQKYVAENSASKIEDWKLLQKTTSDFFGTPLSLTASMGRWIPRRLLHLCVTEVAVPVETEPQPSPGDDLMKSVILEDDKFTPPEQKVVRRGGILFSESSMRAVEPAQNVVPKKAGAALAIQRAYRGSICRSSNQGVKLAASTFQMEGMEGIIQFHRARQAALRIQSNFRGRQLGKPCSSLLTSACFVPSDFLSFQPYATAARRSKNHRFGISWSMSNSCIASCDMLHRCTMILMIVMVTAA